MLPIDRQAAIDALRASRSISTNLFIGRLFNSLNGSRRYDFNIEMMKLVMQMSNKISQLESALAHLIDPDASAELRSQFLPDDSVQSGAGSESSADRFDPLDRFIATTLYGELAEDFLTAASIAHVSIPNTPATYWWCTHSRQLGPAIEATFNHHLQNGTPLFISEVAIQNGSTTEISKVTLPAGTQISWTHPNAIYDGVSALAREIELQIREYGGIYHDADGSLQHISKD